MLLAIKKEIEQALQSAGVKGGFGLSVPPKPELGDLSFTCFEVAKNWKMSPAEAAKKIEVSLDSLRQLADRGNDNIVEKIKAFGPYVNFYLNSGKTTEVVLKAIQKQGKKYGQSKLGAGKKALIEYPSNNTHKELHIGHLRNICIGNALVNLFSVSGHKTISVNYVNDFGAHVARCLWGLQKFHAKENPPADKQKWLGEIYAESSQYLAQHPKLAGEVAELQKKLEAKDKTIWPLFKQTRAWSLEGFDKAFKELGVKHKAVFYEKDVKDKGQKVVDELLKKNIAKVGEGGAIIADLKPYGLDIGLLRKSNGSGLYLTSDLGLAKAKAKKYKPSESIHITGTEQDFYFKQLFKILELAGYKYKMTHLGYGLVNLPTGKMSSREGKVVLYETVRDEVYKDVWAETKSRHHDWPEKQVEETAKKISLAAIKFEFLKHEAAKIIVFNIEEAISFNGFTGPYVLYAVARINSLLKKAKSAGFKVNSNLLKEPEEKKTVLLLAGYDEVLKKALENYNPSVLVKYAFDVAQQFNDFYNKHNVTNAGSEELIKARLALCVSVKQVLENVLEILTMETVEEM
ncbi:MAG: arginine--tRNA ligase [Patescibacteria group bacterium]